MNSKGVQKIAHPWYRTVHSSNQTHSVRSTYQFSSVYSTWFGSASTMMQSVDRAVHSNTEMRPEMEHDRCWTTRKNFCRSSVMKTDDVDSMSLTRNWSQRMDIEKRVTLLVVVCRWVILRWPDDDRATKTNPWPSVVWLVEKEMMQTCLSVEVENVKSITERSVFDWET